MSFIISEGEIIEKGNYRIPEKFFAQSAVLSQKVWFGFGGIPLFEENLGIMRHQAKVLGFSIPLEFENQRELFRLVKRMLNKNRYYRSGHIVFQIYYNENILHTLISSIPFVEFTFPFYEDGALAEFSSQKKYSPNKNNPWPFFNEPLWLAAAAEIKDTAVRQAIILNENNAVCECAFSNIFIIEGNELKTPSFKSGCHENALRIMIIKAASNLGLKISEPISISQEEIFEADEVFTASEIKGIQWIMGIEKQRYIHYFSVRIAEELNNILKAKALANSL